MFPKNSETLIGRTYEYGEIISLPNSKYFMLVDLPVFEDKFVMSLPICSENFKDPVIGVMICIRKEKGFSEFEAWAIEKYGENLAEVLERIFIENLPSVKTENNCYTQDDILKSPNTKFRDANKEKISIFPDSFALSENDEKLVILDSCLAISMISKEKFEKLQEILLEVDSTQDTLLFYENIFKVVGCKTSNYYILCDFNSTLENVATKTRLFPSPLLKLCLEKRTSIYYFNSEIQSPNLSAEEQKQIKNELFLKSYKSGMIVPVTNHFNSIVGILEFDDFDSRLEEPDFKLIHSLSLFAWLLFLDVESKN